MPYLPIIFISISLLGCADRFVKINKKHDAKILIALAALLPCLLAGLRADTVGIDVMWYVKPNFESAKLYDSVIEYSFNESSDILYAILVWGNAHLFDDIGPLLFLIQAITITPVFLILYKNRFNSPMWMGGAVYLILIYNYSYSLMRQCMAGALLLTASYMFENKKFKKGYVFCFLAIMFHSSAIIIALILLAFYRFDRIKENRYMMIFIVLVSAIIIFRANDIIDFLVSHGLINVKYQDRMNYYSATQGNYFKVTYFSLWAFLSILALKENETKDSSNSIHINVYHALSIISVFIIMGGNLFSDYFARLSYYFYFFYIISIPNSVIRLKFKNAKTYTILKLMFLIYLVFFWTIVFGKYNSFNVFPYIMR